MSSSRRIRLLFALLAAVLFSFGPSLSFSQAGAASGCMDNNLVKSFAVASPRRGALVRDPFYLKLDATVFDADAFTAINERFSLCIESQLLDQQHNSGHSASNSYYRQCGLHVFDDHAVPGLRPALTSPSEVLDVQLQSVTVSLHYRHESEDVLLCSSHTEVLCCSEEEDPSLTSADSSASDVLATDPSKRKAVIASFLQFFEKLKLKEAPTVQLPERLLQATRDSPADRNIITVLIGIKSFAMNAAKRQAIRDTWLSNRLVCTPAHCIEVVPVFIVGNSPYASSNLEIAECLLIEQEMHRDLLLGFNSSALSAIGVGIPVEDSYFSLPQKVLHFFAWAVNGGAAAYLRHMHRSDDGRDDNSSPFDLNALVKCDIHRDNNYIFRGCYHSKDSTEDFLTKFDYVVIADDDVYVDLQQLNKVLCDPATPKNYFYAGEV